MIRQMIYFVLWSASWKRLRNTDLDMEDFLTSLALSLKDNLFLFILD